MKPEHGLSGSPLPLQDTTKQELALAFFDAHDMLKDMRDVLHDIEALVDLIVRTDDRLVGKTGV